MSERDDDRLLDRTELAAYLGVSPGRILDMNCQGNGPKRIRIGGGPRGQLRWRMSDVQEWLRQREVEAD